MLVRFRFCLTVKNGMNENRLYTVLFFDGKIECEDNEST